VLLKELWSHGQNFNAEQVAAALGENGLSFDRIIGDYKM